MMTFEVGLAFCLCCQRYLSMRLVIVLRLSDVTDASDVPFVCDVGCFVLGHSVLLIRQPRSNL